MKRYILLWLLLMACLSQVAAQVTYWHAPAGSTLSDDFEVSVRTAEKKWESLPVYRASVANTSGMTKRISFTSFVYFDLAGSAELMIRMKNGNAKQVLVRPYQSAVLQHRGNTVFIKLTRPVNLSIEVDGNRFNNLQVFAGHPEQSKPAKDTPGMLYYGSGIHQTGTVRLKSGQTVYLAGDAIVRGQFIADHVRDVKILGRGIIEHGEGPIEIFQSQNILVDGITMLNPKHNSIGIEMSDQVNVKNFRSFSCEGWGDGIDIFCSSRVTLENIFMRNSDDCIAIYGHRGKYWGNVNDVKVYNSTLWADVAHPILVGTHGDSKNPDTLAHLYFKNIDILQQQEHQIDYQGCLALNAGDSNLLTDIRFEDIRIDDISKGQLFNIRVMNNKKYNTSPGAGIHGVLFKNISYRGDHASMSIVMGYDEKRTVRDLIFENLIINGTQVHDKMAGKPAWFKTGDMAGIFFGEHVFDYKFLSGEDSK